MAAHKNLAVVHDSDNSGRILRVGYFFQERGKEDLTPLSITWFDPSEIQITSTSTPVREFERACLDVKFTHPRENERHFLLNLTSDPKTRVILRNLFRIQKDSITGFVIQVEIWRIIDGKEETRPVVRYDHAHGIIHRDMIDSDGCKTKHELGTQDTKDAISMAIDEIRSNLNLWLQQLGYEPIAPHVLSQPRFIQEMNNAKSALLELHDNPGKIVATQSTFTVLKEEFDYDERIWHPLL